MTEVSEKPVRRIRKVRVMVVRQRGESALVQWTSAGLISRCYIPVEEIGAGEKVGQDVLEAGIPFGLPFHELMDDIHITSVEVCNALRQRAFWTMQDIETKPQAAVGAINQLIAKKVGELISSAKEFEREDE